MNEVFGENDSMQVLIIILLNKFENLQVEVEGIIVLSLHHFRQRT